MGKIIEVPARESVAEEVGLLQRRYLHLKGRNFTSIKPWVAMFVQHPDYLLAPELVDLYSRLDKKGKGIDKLARKAADFAVTVISRNENSDNYSLVTKVFNMSLLEQLVNGEQTTKPLLKKYCIDNTNCLNPGQESWESYLNLGLDLYHRKVNSQ